MRVWYDRGPPSRAYGRAGCGSGTTVGPAETHGRAWYDRSVANGHGRGSASPRTILVPPSYLRALTKRLFSEIGKVGPKMGPRGVG